MSSNRPGSKSSIFAKSNVEPIKIPKEQSLETTRLDPLDIAIQADEERAITRIQEAIQTSTALAKIISDNLNLTDVNLRSQKADDILRELQALNKHFNGLENIVITHIMKQLTPFASRLTRRLYEARPTSFPHSSYEKIHLLYEIIPNFLNAIRYNPDDEKKEVLPAVQNLKPRS